MKTTILLPVISLFLFLASCTNPSDKKVNDQTSESSESGVTSTDWQSRYDKLEASDLPDNVIQLIGKEWMLVTAGNENSFNTMTASWGGMGYIWERPSTFIFIRAILINSSNSMRVSPSASLMKNIAMPCVYAVQCQEGIRIR